MSSAEGEKQPVYVAIDLEAGEPITVGYINEYDPQAIIRGLRPLVQENGISVIVTDNLLGCVGSSTTPRCPASVG